jgi:integrase
MKTLTVKAIDNVKPKSKPSKMFDGGGLYLLVKPNGSKLWRFKYRFGGGEKLISLGKYPETSLKLARDKRTSKRAMLDAEPPIDPSEERKSRNAALVSSFKAVGDRWFEQKQSDLAVTTRERNRFILDRLSDRLGKQPISKITTPDMKAALISIQNRNGPETARRAKGIASRVFAYAIADGEANTDPTAGLTEILKERNTKSRSAVTKPSEVGRLMRSIYKYKGQATTVAGLKLLALNFTRPTELRLGKWSEIDFEKSLWEIPASRMKMRRRNPQPHLLPLSDQSVDILKELRGLTDGSEWVFPSFDLSKPLSENAFNSALKKMGFDGGTHTAHGFRSTASSLLHELNFSAEVIETQLAHARPGVAGIYNRSNLLPQRKEMLQAWADHLDQLRNGAKVVPIGSKTAAS